MEADIKALLVIIPVEGMTCNSCVQTIQQKIGSLNGVHSIQVSLEGKNAAIIYDPKLQTSEALREAIDDMGFEAPPAETSPQPVPTVNTFLYLSEEQSVEQIRNSLLQLKGVMDVKTSLEEKVARVTFIPSTISTEVMVQKYPGLSLQPIFPKKISSGSDVQVKMKIEGMTCHSCTSTIEGKIGKLNGILRIKGVSPLHSNAVIEVSITTGLPHAKQQGETLHIYRLYQTNLMPDLLWWPAAFCAPNISSFLTTPIGVTLCTPFVTSN
ncbi:copper-transporting ATPase 1 [Pelobates cultripes]|uniref:Copper-transporting ATPase 1 n=1 Tax=Pelobates cultripes TaxID=61616 RepID=A0AAD1WIV2_PELCU|nr:copper-transporting ATPase 1 [Pelobates cultripes]